MTDTEIINLIEREGLWIHPSGYPGGWSIDNTKGRWVWNKPTLRGAIEAYKLTEPVEVPAKHPADGLGEIFTSDEYNQANRE